MREREREREREGREGGGGMGKSVYVGGRNAAYYNYANVLVHTFCWFWIIVDQIKLKRATKMSHIVLQSTTENDELDGHTNTQTLVCLPGVLTLF